MKNGGSDYKVYVYRFGQGNYFQCKLSNLLSS